MCFGVRDALDAIADIRQPEDVTIHGELVHNEDVLHHLDQRGFHRTPETDRDGVPETPVVLITAHGISDARRSWLQAGGKQLVDTTCPLVRKVHDAAQYLASRGFHIVVIGKPGHVEVRGIVEDLESYDVLASPDQARRLPHDRIGIVCQTTVATALTGEIRAAIEKKNPEAEIVFEDTVCQPTKQRGESLDSLLDRVEALVVVGGSNSNNTRQLVSRAESRGIPAYHVRGPDDLHHAWLRGYRTVGLTAGTSTPDHVIDSVHAALVQCNGNGG